MERVKAFLTNKVGPFPGYVWILVIAALAFGYMTLTQKKASEEALSDESLDNEGKGESEFSGSVSSEKTDAAGNVLSSQYDYSGSGVTTPGSIGFPSGYSYPPEITVNVDTPPASAPAASSKIYKTVSGDTIATVAKKTNAPWEAIWRVNSDALKYRYKMVKWKWGKHGTGSGTKIPSGTTIVVP